MRTVESMIKELKKFPKDAMCYGYEGEYVGLGIVYKNHYGFIRASEGDKIQDSISAELLVKDSELLAKERP
jgi:hypothetical protein